MSVEAYTCLADGIAACLRPVCEDDVPQWLRRHVPDESALAVLPESERHRRETDITQAIDRIVGACAYHGWKGGYFDSEQDAAAFYDELRWLLWQRRTSPDIHRWRDQGLYWAYGLQTGDGFITDYRNGAVRRAGENDGTSCGAFVNGVRDSLAGEGGVWDLWRRESSILQHGGDCGTNISALFDSDSDSVAERLLAALEVGDAASRTVRPSVPASATLRRVTIDASHSGWRAIIRRASEKAGAGAAQTTGTALARRHVQAMIDACRKCPSRKAVNPEANPALRMAIRSAQQAMLPESMIARTLELLEQGVRLDADELFGRGQAPIDDDAMPDDGAVGVVRAGDEALQEEPGLVHETARAAWTSGSAGLLFETAAEAWNTCPESGSVRSASGDGAFLFLDDTASDSAVLNAASFLLDDGTFDTDGFRHAVRLIATALDISLMTTAYPTPRLARRVWDFRPIGLSLTGVAELLMARGIRYDSDEGRATGAALCALMSGTAYLNAARLAAEMGPFPAWAENAAAMQRTVHRHGEAAIAIPDADFPGLPDAVRDVWQAADDEGACHGFRNAYVSHIVDAPATAALLGCASRGVQPVASLVRFVALPAGGWRKAVAPAVPRGLRALGYGGPQLDAILNRLLGHGTLEKAPGVNHETLRKRGFSESAIRAIEAALPTASHIGEVFDSAVLGDAYCRRMLGFTAVELGDEDFDMLAALGFSDAGVAAANAYCCGAGTLEGAAELDPDHLAVFDTAVPQGSGGGRQVAVDGILRMTAAIQPMISGAIGQTVTMPPAAPIADYREALLLGWRLGLRSVTITRRSADPSSMARADSERSRLPMVAAPVLSIVESEQAFPLAGSAPRSGNDGRAAMSQALALAHTARAVGASAQHFRTDVATTGGSASSGAEASRRAASHAARSTASVPSSADVVVEQRQV